MRIRQNGALEKFTQFLFMCFSVSCIIIYSAIKIYAVQIYVDSHNSHKLTHAEKCRFTVSRKGGLVYSHSCHALHCLCILPCVPPDIDSMSPH